MTNANEWSPDEQLGTETFEQADEALEEEIRLDPDALEQIQLDPALDPALWVDERELEEVGAELDNPEKIVTLEGGGDDPDGIDEPSIETRPRRSDDEGWDLDASQAGQR